MEERNYIINNRLGISQDEDICYDSSDSQETRYTDDSGNDSDNELNFDVNRLQEGIALCEHERTIPCLEEKDGLYFGKFNSINNNIIKYGYGRKNIIMVHIIMENGIIIKEKVMEDFLM